MLNFIQSGGPRSVVVLLTLRSGGGIFDVIFLTTEFLTALLLAFVGVFKTRTDLLNLLLILISNSVSRRVRLILRMINFSDTDDTIHGKRVGNKEGNLSIFYEKSYMCKISIRPRMSNFHFLRRFLFAIIILFSDLF